MLLLLKNYWKHALIGLAVLAFTLGTFYLKALRAENARLAELGRQNQVAIERLKSDLEANRRALELRQAESAKLAEQRQEAVKSLEAIYERIKKLAIGALALSQTAFIASCANKTPAAMTVCFPPVVYLQDVAEPALGGNTNKDLAEYVLGLREAVRRSNMDKFHLREWMEENANGDGNGH